MKYSESGVARERATLYNTLSLLHYTPEKRPWTLPLAFLSESYPDLVEVAERLVVAFTETTITDLKADHAQLFVGPYELSAAPYGSVYLDGGRRVMGDSTMEVRRIYRATGLQLRDDFAELPDHIAVELEFLHYAAWKEYQALEVADADEVARWRTYQLEFLHGQLLRWLPQFCADVKAHAGTAAYLALAEFVGRFVPADATALGRLVTA